MSRVIVLSLFLFTSSLTSSQTLAQIYRWVDEKGQVQFSDRPVKGKASSKIEIDTSKNSYGGGDVLNRQRDLLDRYDQQDQKSQENKKQAQREEQNQKKLESACLRAKDQLASYERGLIYTLDGQGERVYYSEEVRAQKIESYRQSITKNCK